MSHPTNAPAAATRTPAAPGSVGQPAGPPTAAGKAVNFKQSAVAVRLGATTVSMRRSMSGTPGRLRVLALSTVAVSLIFALAAFSTFGSTNDALGRGEANTAQLVRIQAIHTNLIRADADATNAFLVGGLEPAAQRTEYTSSLAQAARLIAEAAKAQPADGPALGALNSTMLTYAGLIEQARATNRQALRWARSTCGWPAPVCAVTPFPSSTPSSRPTKPASLPSSTVSQGHRHLSSPAEC